MLFIFFIANTSPTLLHFFFSSRSRHTRSKRDWSSDVCSSDLGPATHDEREARDTFPAALFEQWGKRDPIGMYEEYLKADGITVKRLGDIEAEVIEEVERSAEQALQSRDRMPPGESALQGVYAKHGT